MNLKNLIDNAAQYDTDTAWLLNYIGKRMNPSDETLNLESEVIAEPLADFRKKTGGVLKIGENIVAAGSGKGYLNGEKGPWSEMRKTIAATLGGTLKAVPFLMKKVVADATATETAAVADAVEAVADAVTDEPEAEIPDTIPAVLPDNM